MPPRVRRTVSFIDTPGGQRFCSVTRPVGGLRGSVVFVPPFAEELNKSRRMVAIAAEAFAEQGWLVVQLDPLGCGDSPGLFGEATWKAWLDDLTGAWVFAAREAPDVPVVLWSLRAGSLLASDWLNQQSTQAHLLMWQPVMAGKQHLVQFIRLVTASGLANAENARSAAAEARNDLKSGRSVEIAGYQLGAELAAELDASVVELPDTFKKAVHAIEVSGSEGRQVSPSLSKALAAMEACGIDACGSVVAGPSFWLTQEIELAPDLIPASLSALEAWAA